ncbi:MAG TPA: STAS domain-containing protein [Coxiellaceae bacterium]|nr:STAS domain-containing protein [Coxiellaceae bacterium]
MTIAVATSDGFHLQGQIGFDNAVALREQGERFISARQTITIDLTELQERDASIFSVLLCWHRFAKQKHCVIRFSNVPAAIERMAELFSLTNLLQI